MMTLLFKLGIGLVIAGVSCLIAIKFPLWSWTAGWLGASLYWVVVPLDPFHAAMPKPSRPAPPMPECKPPRTEQADRIQALSLAAGDTLILEHKDKLSNEVCKRIDDYARECLPDGCKVMVLHGGVRAAGSITAKRPVPHIPQPSPGR